jgi:hypothetical protein
VLFGKETAITSTGTVAAVGTVDIVGYGTSVYATAKRHRRPPNETIPGQWKPIFPQRGTEKVLIAVAVVLLLIIIFAGGVR